MEDDVGAAEGGHIGPPLPDNASRGGLPSRGPGAGRFVAPAAGLLSLVVYILTLAPGLTLAHNGADGGDLIAAAFTRGVPHPSGYPTYTLLAWLATYLPLGSIAFRVNLLSAACAALAAGLLCAAARRLLAGIPHAGLISAAAALSLAFSSLVWSQAVIAEVYALLLLFAAVLLWLIVEWRRTAAGRDGLLWLAALVFGLGLGNHLALAFMLPGALVLLWPHRRRWRRPRAIVPALTLFLAGLSVYAYLPLAAAHRPPVNWGDARTCGGLWWVVSGQIYHHYILSLDPAAIPGRLAAWAGLLGDQFGWWGLVLVVWGTWCWWQMDRRLAVAAAAWMLPAAVYAFLYGTSDSHVLLLPLLLPLALAWALGASGLVELVGRVQATRRLAPIVVVLLPLVSLAVHYPAADLSHDRSGATLVQRPLAMAPGNALVVTRTDPMTFALWYALYVEGQRPDIAVVNEPLLAYGWYRGELRELYPDLVVPEPAGAPAAGGLLPLLTRANAGSRPVYIAEPGQVALGSAGSFSGPTSLSRPRPGGPATTRPGR